MGTDTNEVNNIPPRSSKGYAIKERYSFLDDFSGRTLSLAIPFQIAQYAEKNVLAYRLNSDITGGIFYQLVNMVLLFIEDRAVKSEECTIDDIAEMLTDVGVTKFNLKFDAYRPLAVDIVYNVFLNSGKMLTFDAYNEKHNEVRPFEIKLITETFSKESGKDKASFGLTPQGFKYIYLTKELEDLSEVDIDQIKLIKAIKKGNFKGARFNVNSLFQKVEIQRQIIEYGRKTILNDIVVANIDDIIKNIDDSHDLIDSQILETRHILDLIKDFHNVDKDVNIVMWQNVQNGLEDIEYIDSKLHQILNKQLKLVLEVSSLRKTLKDSLADVSFMLIDKKFSIMDDVIKPLERDFEGDFNLFNVMRGLFNYKIDKRYSPYQMFLPQDILSTEFEEDKYSLQPDEADEQSDYSEILKIDANNKKYEKIFLLIIDRLLKEGEVRLEDMLKDTTLLIQDIQATKVVLVTLFNESNIYFEEGEYIESVGSFEQFVPSMVVRKYKYDLVGYHLTTYQIDEQDLMIKSVCDENSMFENTLRVPNMLFALRKEL